MRLYPGLMMDKSKEILTGWKEIEAFLGIKRETIIKLQFPVKKMDRIVIAQKSELLTHLNSFPSLIALNRTRS